MGKETTISKSFGSKSFSSKSSHSTKTFQGGYIFINSEAEDLYNAHVSENGGLDIDSNGLYSISLYTLKEGLDNAVGSLISTGLWAKVVRFFIPIGGTADTHSINWKTASSELLYVGSPGQTAAGTILNGTTQYIDVNNVPNNDGSVFNFSLSHWIKNVTNGVSAAGSRDSTSVGMFQRVLSNTTYSGQILAVNMTPTAVTNASQMITSSIRSNASGGREIYENDSSIFTAVGISVTTNSIVRSTKFGAWDNNGSILQYSAGNFVFGWVGYGVTDTDVSNLHSIVNTFNSLLGR